jgi:hypothetical protein
MVVAAVLVWQLWRMGFPGQRPFWGLFVTRTGVRLGMSSAHRSIPSWLPTTARWSRSPSSTDADGQARSGPGRADRRGVPVRGLRLDDGVVPRCARLPTRPPTGSSRPTAAPRPAGHPRRPADLDLTDGQVDIIVECVTDRRWVWATRPRSSCSGAAGCDPDQPGHAGLGRQGRRHPRGEGTARRGPGRGDVGGRAAT